MGIEMRSSFAGLRLDNAMQTSTETRSTVQFRKFKMFKASFDFPEDKLEFIHLTYVILQSSRTFTCLKLVQVI